MHLDGVHFFVFFKIFFFLFCFLFNSCSFTQKRGVKKGKKHYYLYMIVVIISTVLQIYPILFYGKNRKIGQNCSIFMVFLQGMFRFVTLYLFFRSHWIAKQNSYNVIHTWWRGRAFFLKGEGIFLCWLTEITIFVK